MPHQDSVTLQIERHLCFVVSGQEFGIDVPSVIKIIHVPAFSRVFNVPDYVTGLINHYGDVVAVLDPGLMLGLGGVVVTRNSRVIVVKTGEITAGLLVSSVSGIKQLDMGSCQPVSAAVVGVRKDCLKGIVQTPERPVLLLDLESMLSDASLEEDSQ